MAHKYHAKPTVVDGIRFASQKEARRYGELKLLEKAGKIDTLELQPVFELELFSRGEFHKLGTYRGDFKYWDKADTATPVEVVEDVKGFKTPLYKWKKKHVEAQYGVQIIEI